MHNVLPGVGSVELTVMLLVSRNYTRRFITEMVFIEQLQFYTRNNTLHSTMSPLMYATISQRMLLDKINYHTCHPQVHANDDPVRIE